MRDAIRRWWEGAYEEEYEPPHNGLVFMLPPLKRHWTARLARTVLGFVRAQLVRGVDQPHCSRNVGRRIARLT